ncbi:MAG: HPr(Ser) kinase/phosphatase [Clostridia bacterium]|nr:HPr(Ser) kinase/phosphatase [Clostridia bacterium]
MFSVKISEIIKTLKLEKLYCTDEMLETEIDCADVNRPSLQLTGFFDYFNPKRIQIIGKVEMTYLDKLDEQERKKRVEALFSKGVPAAIVTREMEPYPEMFALAEQYGVPLLRSNDSTSRFMGELIKNLNVWLAPRITRHGVLVEVYGEGLLLLGESGVGKSEAAIELLKRGHRLVADDAVEIKKVSDSTLVGTSPEIIRHFIELRGIGIVNVRNIFGIGAVKETENINLVVNLEPWQQGVEYERLGLDNGHTEILDIQIPSITIPVKQGRNLAVILEVAAMNNRQKRMGFNAAQELNQRLMDQNGLA